MIRMELYIDPVQAKQLAEEGFDALRPDLLDYARTAARDFETRMRRLLGRTGTGREYKTFFRTHRASAPGGAPASFTREYANSYATDVRSLKRSVQGRIGAQQMGFLAWILEYGSKFMRPRPHIRHVFNVWRAAIDRDIGRASAE